MITNRSLMISAISYSNLDYGPHVLTPPPNPQSDIQVEYEEKLNWIHPHEKVRDLVIKSN